jgi:hypothetical protein
MTGARSGELQIMPARAQRKRSRVAVSTGKTEDILACLHGEANGGAEKKRIANFMKGSLVW